MEIQNRDFLFSGLFIRAHFLGHFTEEKKNIFGGEWGGRGYGLGR